MKRIIAVAAEAPAYLTPKMVKSYYRYDSGLKRFKEIPCNKNFSIAVDAVALHQ